MTTPNEAQRHLVAMTTLMQAERWEELDRYARSIEWDSEMVGCFVGAWGAALKALDAWTPVDADRLLRSMGLDVAE